MVANIDIVLFQIAVMTETRCDGGRQLEDALEFLKSTFKHSNFKTPLQRDAVLAVLKGNVYLF